MGSANNRRLKAFVLYYVYLDFDLISPLVGKLTRTKAARDLSGVPAKCSFAL